MTVSQTEITAILQRLARVEERQNLLKDNLLSLKKQVSALEHAFQDRPELPQLKAIQAQLNQLAEFGDRPISSSSTPNAITAEAEIDADILVMPLMDDDNNFDDLLGDDSGNDLSGLLGVLDDDGTGDLDVSMLDMDIDELEAMAGLSVDDMELTDVQMDVATNFETLDLDTMSLDDLERLDFSTLSGIDEASVDDSFELENEVDNFGALAELTDSPRSSLGLLQSPLGVEAQPGRSPLNEEALDLGDRLGDDSEFDGDLDNLDNIDDIDDISEIGDIGSIDDISGDINVGENSTFLNLEPLALDNLDLAELSDLESDLEIESPQTAAVTPELEINALNGVSTVGEPLDLDEIEFLDATAFDEELDEGDLGAIAAIDLDKLSGLDEISPFPESRDNIFAVDELEALSATDLDPTINVDLSDADIDLDQELFPDFAAPGHFPAEMSDLGLGKDVGELNLDMHDHDLELELAAEMPEYDEITGLDLGDEIPQTVIPEPIIPDFSDFSGRISPRLSEPVVEDFALEPELDLEPELEPEAIAPTFEETIDFEEVLEEEIVEIDIDTLPDTPLEPFPTAESIAFAPMAIADPSERQPMVDTEDPEDLAPTPDPAIAIPTEAELTASEVLTRIANRQYYFIGLQLPQLQLSQQNLRDCVFDQSNLQAVEFHNTDLRDCSFRESNLQDANLEYTSLERANFEQANLRNANFKGILFNRRTNFKGANLQGADFSYLDLSEPPDFKQANLSQAYFLECNLRGADLSQWNLTGAKLCRANLIEANLRNANLTDADLRGAVYNYKTIFPEGFQPQGALFIEAGADLKDEDLQGLDLTSLDLTRVNFSGANLEQTKLDYCDLSEANFSGANLRRAEMKATALEVNLEGANLTQADLTEANFTGSNCKQANFQSATLKNANFTMTDLRGANFKGANTYRLNCNGSNLEGIDLTDVNFEGDLSGANLTRAKLQNLNLNYLNLSWANLTEADLTGASLKETNLDNANLTNAVGFRTEEHDYTIYLNNTVLPDGSTWD